MEPIMMPKELECGEAMKQPDTGRMIRSFPMNEQLSTGSCARCAGLLVSEWYYGLSSTGEHSIETFRCVQCGHRVDPVILQNQIRPPSEKQPVRQARQRYSRRTALLNEHA